MGLTNENLIERKSCFDELCKRISITKFVYILWEKTLENRTYCLQQHDLEETLPISRRNKYTMVR